MSQQNLSSFIWSVADLLRGDYKQSEYGKVILPFTVLRRLDCVLDPTKEAVLKEKEKREAAKLNPEVPAYWEVRRLKFVSEIQTGDKDTVDAEEDGEYPFFVRSQTVERISTQSFDCEATCCSSNDSKICTYSKRTKRTGRRSRWQIICRATKPGRPVSATGAHR